MSASGLSEGGVVRLIQNAVSRGDRVQAYPAGYEFRLLKALDTLPDAGAVATEFHFGDRERPPARTGGRIVPQALVRTLDGARLRLLFDAKDVERVPAGDCTSDF